MVFVIAIREVAHECEELLFLTKMVLAAQTRGKFKAFGSDFAREAGSIRYVINCLGSYAASAKATERMAC